MTKSLRLFLGSVASILALAALTAEAAAPIQGSIQFIGGATLNGNLGSASSYLSYSGSTGSGNPQVQTDSGTFSTVPAGTSVAFTPFTFSPTPASVPSLWSFSLGGVNYSFDVSSFTLNSQNSGFLDLEGTGMLHAGGFADTPAIFSITDTGAGGPNVTFGASFTAVPEPSALALGTLAVLLGLRLRRNLAV